MEERPQRAQGVRKRLDLRQRHRDHPSLLGVGLSPDKGGNSLCTAVYVNCSSFEWAITFLSLPPPPHPGANPTLMCIAPCMHRDQGGFVEGKLHLIRVCNS